MEYIMNLPENPGAGLFKEVDIRFVVLMVDAETLLIRDKERPIDCQMGARSLELLEEFKQDKYNEKYILDSSDMSVIETVTEINVNSNFKV